MVTKEQAKKNTKKKTSKSKSKSTPKKKFDFGDISIETYSIVLICISILLFFSVNINLDFILTSFLKYIFIFVFGIVAYIIPILLISLGSYMFVTKKHFTLKKYILSLSLLIIIASFAHIMFETKLETLLPNFSVLNVSNPNFNLRLGGMIGALFGGILLSLIGKFLSALFLIISAIFIITVLINKSISDFNFDFTKITDLFNVTKLKIENSLKFDDKNNNDFIEKDIIFTEDNNRKTSKLSTDDSIVITETIDELKELEKTDFSKGFGIQRKRDTNKVPEDNNLFKNKSQPKEQKPTVQVNKRKLNPFAKKPKIKIYDFTANAEPAPAKPINRIDREPKTSNDDNYFLNVRKGSQPNEQADISFSNSDENYEHVNFYQEQQSTQSASLHIIDEYEKTIKALKTELDRQMFLFQDAQQTFSQQKSVEKNLLTIINAQRETIERQSAEIKAYKMSMQIQNTTAMQEPVSQIQNTPITHEPVNTVQNIEQPVSQINDFNNNIDSIFNDIASNLENIEVPTYSTQNDYNNNSFEQNFDNYDNEEITSYSSTNDEKYASISFDLDEEDFEESNEDSLSQDNYQQNDYSNDYNFGIPETSQEYNSLDTANILDTIATTTLEPSLTSEALQNITKGLVSDSFTPSYTASSFENSYEPPSYENSHTPTTQSIFKNEHTPKYNTPIKPNFDTPVVEEYIYKYPTVDFLNEKEIIPREHSSKTELIANSKKLEATLKSFGVVAKVMEVSKGPSVTRYEVQPGLGVKVSKIANLSDDLALNLAAKSIRIQAPIPGKAAVGIEVPNETTETVPLREVLDDENFKNFKSKLAFGIGKDISGKIVVADLATMPHLLIAGATGSGKSVCVNTLITSIVYKSSPKEVKLLMIDPKVVELSVYNGIPHLLIPVVTDPKKASAALNWAVREMEKRYKLFSDKNVRDLKGYNAAMEKEDGPLEPQIVIIIDELADLMMTASKEVEAAIIRIAQMARAAGIHLIIATQRPTADVITGLIKSNIPSRLAFSVSSGLDSKIILDETGAEKLLGKGDMLFKPMGAPEPFRIQGAFISDKEVESIVTFLKKDAALEHNQEIIEEITSAANPRSSSNESADTVDDIFEEVVEFIISQQKASTSLIQRRFRVGFNRAARIVDELENFGIIGPDEGNKPRKVLMSMSEWDNKFRT